MYKSIKFISTTLFIVATRAYDVYATYQHTPDLKNETNPLVSVLGMSWLPLLFVIGALLAYIIYANYQATFSNFSLFPPQKGYSFGEFVAYLYLGKKTSWTACFYQFPKSFKRFTNYMGNIMTHSLIIAGTVSTIMWYLIRNTVFYKTYHNPVVIYSLIIIGMGLWLYYWLQNNYQQYIQQHEIQ